ncbi:uncharacterized protein LOC120685914 isoform X10 [Panicum virgatum]|uniref:uncharacterized protein LOC120685914 isoform X10 n=1 Tax=Panicum virgatum TaxID=38727 RepID=UPI0019D69255|nr:uncharacterized protein LOC120685914 isoform X10 [Panicum virgatum]
MVFTSGASAMGFTRPSPISCAAAVPVLPLPCGGPDQVMKPYKGSKACEQVYPSGLHYHHPTTFVGVPAAIAMTAAVPSTSASLLPASAARPLAGSTVSFGASYQKRRKIPAWRVRCSADDEGEISPLLPSSCRYVPTCSEYSMQAYKRYGVVKGLHHIIFVGLQPCVI